MAHWKGWHHFCAPIRTYQYLNNKLVGSLLMYSIVPVSNQQADTISFSEFNECILDVSGWVAADHTVSLTELSQVCPFGRSLMLTLSLKDKEACHKVCCHREASSKKTPLTPCEPPQPVGASLVVRQVCKYIWGKTVFLVHLRTSSKTPREISSIFVYLPSYMFNSTWGCQRSNRCINRFTNSRITILNYSTSVVLWFMWGNAVCLQQVQACSLLWLVLAHSI